MTNKDTANVKIKDNGKGIPDEQKDKLFMPNFTTKTSGMGLGLAIVKNIVENCDGKIDFETELGRGTTFIIELPLYKEAGLL
jgi:two-component system nitrogen regulation sensor histidine kinase NtrY